MNSRKLAMLVFLIFLPTSSLTLKANSSEHPLLIEELIFTGNDASIRQGDGLERQGDSLTLAGARERANYTSPIISTPIPFNAVVPEWYAELPLSTDLKIYLRTSYEGTDWEEWREVAPSLDWSTEDDEYIVGDMIVVPAADITHNYIQYKLVLSRDNTASNPEFRELRLVFIDSTAGPTMEEMIAQQSEMDKVRLQSDGYPKPSVISRAVWCTDPRCNYTEGLEYYPVSHLILHHTVTSSDGNSAATVRAIWAYHTLTRGWGDIGYNFLVDSEGIIFEGHLGGDDVVGIHAGNANTGSMAVALIGSYSVVDPPQPMVESAINLFAWKADQRNIDVFDASNTLPNIPWGLPNIMGHRDVYGTTQCPGDHAHGMIPAIRDEVAARIGLVSPYLYVDELSSAFTKSNANWYTPSYQCGHNTHAWYTWSTTNPDEAVNWGEWRPVVPADGRYQIDAHIPYCNTGRSETKGASYTIQHAGGSSNIKADQDANVGLWMSLGEFDLRAGNANVIRLDDLTTTDDGRGVWFDSLRLLQVQVTPSASNIAPLDKSWLNHRHVTFEWQIEHPELATATKLQVATDIQFQNIVTSKEWASAVENVPHTFSQDYAALFWRVVLTSNSGGQYTSIPTQFGIDSEPPVSSVSSLIWLDWIQQYRISWQGYDNLTGVANYTIEFRRAGTGSWQPLLVETDKEITWFTPPETNTTYEFRSQAVDLLGNKEPTHETADIDTQQASFHSHAIILPVIYTDK